ncbi:MAG TPA: hypothetical protein VE291_14075 [Terracidiphilus sp.]|nr:hypothetical protein [Terracidiphilus sp.]
MAMASEATAAAEPGSSAVEEARRLAKQNTANQARRKQELTLQRENILSQRTSSPARRTALEAALKQIEAELEALE